MLQVQVLEPLNALNLQCCKQYLTHLFKKVEVVARAVRCCSALEVHEPLHVLNLQCCTQYLTRLKNKVEVFAWAVRCCSATGSP